MRAINVLFADTAHRRRDLVATSRANVPRFASRTGAAMEHMRHVNFITGIAAIVAVLSAVTPAASAADLLKLAAQRGAWESAAPELRQSAGIFTKHGITLDLVYTRDGQVEPSVTSGSADVGVGVGTIGVLRAYAKGAPGRVIGANTTGTANYWDV